MPNGAKHWTFTLNNYQPEDELSQLPERTTYLLYGREVGNSGTPHLQGLCSFRTRTTRPSALLFNGRAHWEICQNIGASRNYCKKDGDWVELGAAPKGAGARCDLEAFKEAVKSGLQDLNTVREEHPRFCLEYIRQYSPEQEVTQHPLRGWQQELVQCLNQEPDERTINFVVNMQGGEGKSWFSSYYRLLHKEDTFLCLPGKKADMVFALASAGFAPHVVIIDAPRSKQGDYLQYDFLEEVKNGRIFNTKYESRMIEFKPPHVVVMMNEDPDLTKLSEDRYRIFKLN